MPSAEHILDEDDVSRLVFRPADFDDGPRGPLNLARSAFCFPEKEGKRVSSVNCHRFLRKFPDDLHTQGWDLEKQRGNGKTYEGFCSAVTERIRNITYETHGFRVEHCPENDNQAHCHVTMVFETYNKIDAGKIKRVLVDLFHEKGINGSA